MSEAGPVGNCTTVGGYVMYTSPYPPVDLPICLLLRIFLALTRSEDSSPGDSFCSFFLSHLPMRTVGTILGTVWTR